MDTRELCCESRGGTLMWRSQISCVRAVFARHASATLGSRVFAIALAVADADSSPNGHDAPSSAPFVVPNGSCSRCRSSCRSSNSSASGVSAPNNRPKQRIRTDGYLARMDDLPVSWSSVGDSRVATYAIPPLDAAGRRLRSTDPCPELWPSEPRWRYGRWLESRWVSHQALQPD